MVCPNFSDEKTLEEFNRVIEKILLAKGLPKSEITPLTTDHIANLEEFKASASPEMKSAYYQAYYHWSDHKGDVKKIHSYLDSLDKVRNSLAAKPPSPEGTVETRFGTRYDREARKEMVGAGTKVAGEVVKPESYSHNIQQMMDQSSEYLPKLNPVAGYTSKELRDIGKYVPMTNFTATPEITGAVESWRNAQAVTHGIKMAGYYDADLDTKGYWKEVNKIMGKNPNLNLDNVLSNLIKKDGYPGYVKSVNQIERLGQSPERWAFGFGKVPAIPAETGKLGVSEIVQGISKIPQDLGTLIGQAHNNAADLSDFIGKAVKDRFPEVKVSDQTPSFYNGIHSGGELEHSLSITVDAPENTLRAMASYVRLAKNQNSVMLELPVTKDRPVTGRAFSFDVQDGLTPVDIDTAFKNINLKTEDKWYNIEHPTTGKTRVNMYIKNEDLGKYLDPLTDIYKQIGKTDSLKNEEAHVEWITKENDVENLNTQFGETKGNEFYNEAISKGAEHTGKIIETNQPGGMGPEPQASIRGGINEPGKGTPNVPGTAGAKITKESVKSVIEPITKNLKGEFKVNVVDFEDIMDLPKNLQDFLIKSMIDKQRITGVYDPKTKTSYILSHNLKDVSEAQAVLFHEMAHHGLEGMLGDKYESVMKSILDNAKTDSDIFLKLKKDYPNLSGPKFTEEYLARLAESNTEPGILSKAIASIREALRNMGFDMKFTDNDIRNLISRAHKYAQTEGTEPIPSVGLMAKQGKTEVPSDQLFNKPSRRIFESVTPGLNIPKEGIKTTVDAIRSGLLPSSKSPEHLRAADRLGSEIGKKNRYEEMNEVRFRPFTKFFTALHIYDKRIQTLDSLGMKFASDVSQGRLKNVSVEDIAKNYNIPDNAARKIQTGARHIEKVFDKAAQWLDEAKVPIQQFRENYFPGMWTKESRRAFNLSINEFVGKNPELKNTDLNKWTPEQKEIVRNRTQELLKTNKGGGKDDLSYLTRQPFEGKESFRKAKVFDDIMTGAEFGLRPIDPNPFKLVQLKLSEMYKSAMANEFMNKEKANGNVISVNNSGKPMDKGLAQSFNPEEWQNINDKYGTIWYRNESGELVKSGSWIAKKPVAEILNNYLSSSLYNNKAFGPLYRAWMNVANHLNQFQLGMGSAFHAGFTSAEVQIWAGANILKDIYGVMRGNRSFGDLANTVKKFPTAMGHTAYEGSKILKEFRNPEAVDVPTNIRVSDLPQGKDQRIAMIAKAAELGGGGFTFEPGLRTSTMINTIKNIQSKEYIKAAARSPFAAVETFARPILDFLVPRQKAGVFGEMVGRILEMNPDKTLEELTPEFRQKWNKIDMSLGQVKYDRIFMDNAAKNIAQGLIRAPGWSGGTVSLIGGVPKDVAGFFKEWKNTGKVPANIPDRFVYTASLLTSMVVANGLLTYLFTGGEQPKGMDFWAFRTGGKDDKGRDERFLLPTYAKDLFAYYENWGQTVLHKTHPLVGMMSEIMSNKDYYGTEIRDANKPLPIRWLVETPNYVLKQFIPFWLRGAQKATQQSGGFFEKLGKEPLKVVGPEIGIMPASSVYTYSNAEKLINKYSTFEKVMTADERRTSDLKKEVIRQYRENRQIVPEAREAVSKGYLSNSKLHQWIKESSKPDIVLKFNRVNSLGALEAIWKAATPEEQKVLGPIYRRKRSTLKSLPNDNWFQRLMGE